MVDRGRWKRIVPLAAALCVGLASSGCEALVGPQETMEDSPYGSPYHRGQFGPPAPPFRGDPSTVQQVSFRESGASDPAKNPSHLPAPPAGAVEPGLVPGAVLSMPHEPGPIPTELDRTSLPAYRVAPPDILIIDTVRMLPKLPYRIEPLDVLAVVVTGTLPNEPIAGKFVVTPDGAINLGFGYGAVPVAGLTLAQAEAALQQHLSRTLKNARVSVTLDQLRIMQQARGQHLVRPDGTIGLGTYGCVYVAGLTLGQVKCKIEEHLGQFVQDPQISVDVFAYNSRFYYVIFDGGGYGQQIVKLPVTGNETVLDAIGNVGGLPAVSSKKYIWVARPTPCGYGCWQILPVNWRAITEAGDTCTNYQLLPGDRVFVKADCLIATNNYLAKVLAPVERILGITLLGATTVETIRFAGSSTNSGAAVIVP
jgi:polysaccharide export outer membrane protein